MRNRAVGQRYSVVPGKRHCKYRNKTQEELLMPTADIHRWLIAILAALTLQACATDTPHSDAPFEISEDYANNVIRYTIQRGDRLSDIALEFTGNLNSWLPIAEHNGITDPKALRVGSQLEIPTALIPGYEEKRLSRRNQRKDSDAETTDTPKVQLATKDGAPVEQANERSTAINTPPLDVASVSPTRSGEESTSNATKLNSVSNPGSSTKVKVVGSYYPKGVYAEPTLDSLLMMRVAPGSDFGFVEKVDGWFKIETDLGQAYLRARDGRIMSAEP